MIRSQILFSLIVLFLLLPSGAGASLLGNPDQVLLIPWGSDAGQVASDKEDVLHLTDGFPPAFALDGSNSIYILDTGNGRVVKSEAGQTRTLFSYLPEGSQEVPGMRDIALLPDGRIVLADISRRQLEVWRLEETGAGTRETIIEGVSARSIGTTRDGYILVMDEDKNLLLKFTADGELKGPLEGDGLFPVSFSGLSAFAFRMESGEAQVLKVLFQGGIHEICRTKPIKGEEYVCYTYPVGSDSKGHVYLECLFGHDTDPAREQHAYRMFIRKVSLRDGSVVKEVETAPFRSIPSLIAPRQYVIGADGNTYTYEVEKDGFAIYRYNF